MTRKSKRPMLNKAGKDTASENSNVRIPLADLTRRKTLPTRNTLTTRSKVGDTKYWATTSAIAIAEIRGKNQPLGLVMKKFKV